MNHGQFDKHPLVAAVHHAEGGIIAGFRAAHAIGRFYAGTFTANVCGEDASGQLPGDVGTRDRAVRRTMRRNLLSPHGYQHRPPGEGGHMSTGCTRQRPLRASSSSPRSSTSGREGLSCLGNLTALWRKVCDPQDECRCATAAARFDPVPSRNLCAARVGQEVATNWLFLIATLPRRSRPNSKARTQHRTQRLRRPLSTSDSSHRHAYRRAPDRMALNVTGVLCQNCVICPPNPWQHSDLQGDGDAHRCCEKSLIGSALVGFGARQHA